MTYETGAWLILQTTGVMTLPVCRSLAQEGFDVWTPVERRSVRRPRSKARRYRETAIMPRYIFAHVKHIGELAHLALSHAPKFRLFMHGEGFPLITDEALEPLRDEERRQSREYLKSKPRRALTKGETIKTTEGPFAGLTGIVQSEQGQYTLVSYSGFHSPVKISSILLPDAGLDETAGNMTQAVKATNSRHMAVAA